MNDSLIERMNRYADDATACTPEVAQVLREAAQELERVHVPVILYRDRTEQKWDFTSHT